ncbi:MAG: hypothetical protein DLM58_08980 [Pseudonocardiales bacterium]|nr:MAG: hypothetical protein DLM58_08980 [Pseudonocardiales bacterium]
MLRHLRQIGDERTTVGMPTGNHLAAAWQLPHRLLGGDRVGVQEPRCSSPTATGTPRARSADATTPQVDSPV